MASGMNSADILRGAADIFERKSKEYGNNYKQIGHVMAALFPEGLTIRTPQDWNKLHLFLLGMVKKTRYSQNFFAGHADSLLDNIVYGAMLAEVDADSAERPLAPAPAAPKPSAPAPAPILHQPAEPFNPPGAEPIGRPAPRMHDEIKSFLE